MKIAIPIFLIIYIEILFPKHSIILDGRENHKSFLPLVVACIIMSTFQFIITPRIFVAEYKQKAKNGEVAAAFDFDEKAHEDGIDPPSDDISRIY